MAEATEVENQKTDEAPAEESTTPQPAQPDKKPPVPGVVRVIQAVPLFVGLLLVVALGLYAAGFLPHVDVRPNGVVIEMLQHQPVAMKTPAEVEKRPEKTEEEEEEGGRLTFKALTPGPGVPSDLPGSWPNFRGPNHDAISIEDVPLVDTFPADGPKKLWQIDVGDGYAGAVVYRGRAYIMDYDEELLADRVRCVSLADGQDIWNYRYPVEIRQNHGMSRPSPSLSGNTLVAMGPKNHVSCLDADTGVLRWDMDLVEEYGSDVPDWYGAQCPLIDGDVVILAPAGDEVLMMAVELQTGEIRWKTPNKYGWEMTHVSIAPMEWQGRKTYIYETLSDVVAVDSETGEIVWHNEDWNGRTAVCAVPVPCGNGRIFLSAGYGVGSMMLQLKQEGDKTVAEKVFETSWRIFGSEQQTPIYYKGYIYGVREKGQLVCMDPKVDDPAGLVVWDSGADRYHKGYGPWIIADGKIIIVNDKTQEISLVRATPDGYERLTNAPLFTEGHEAAGPLALAGGRLIARNRNSMACFDLRASQD